MTRLEEWFFKRIVKREVRQGFRHDARIIDLYRTIRDACESESTANGTLKRTGIRRFVWRHNNIFVSYIQ